MALKTKKKARPVRTKPLDLTALNRQVEVAPERPPRSKFTPHGSLSSSVGRDVFFASTETHFWYLCDDVYYYSMAPQDTLKLGGLWDKLEKAIKARG